MRTIVILLTLVASILAVPDAGAETLTVVERRFQAMDNLTGCPSSLSAIKLGGDSLMHSSYLGVFVQPDSMQPWEKVIDCVDDYEAISYYDRCYSHKKLKQLVRPEGLWRVPETNEIIVFDAYCDWLYSLHLGTDRDSYVKLWSDRVKDDQFNAVSIQNGLILCGLPRYLGDRALAIQSVHMTRYDKVFEYSERLAQRLDSVGIGIGNPFCYPAFNPHDSTLWLAIYGYDFIYITDMTGHVQDSLPIDASDYIVPPQIKSRIASNAVAVEWWRQWTQTRSLHYAAPGYFLLQYDIGLQEIEGIAFRQHSTVVWKADGEKVPLEVSKRWVLAGVEPDGEIIFSCYETDGEQSGIAFYITRIQP